MNIRLVLRNLNDIIKSKPKEVLIFFKITPRIKTNTTYYHADLIESYRKDGKNKHRFVANIGAVSENEAERLRYVFSKSKKMIPLDDLSISSAFSYGAFYYLFNYIDKLKFSEKFINKAESNIPIFLTKAFDCIKIMVKYC
ncbi:MAG: hypothetical protein ACK5LT_00420 [Lachnospirales bacterium]